MAAKFSQVCTEMPGLDEFLANHETSWATWGIHYHGSITSVLIMNGHAVVVIATSKWWSDGGGIEYGHRLAIYKDGASSFCKLKPWRDGDDARKDDHRFRIASVEELQIDPDGLIFLQTTPLGKVPMPAPTAEGAYSDFK